MTTIVALTDLHVSDTIGNHAVVVGVLVVGLAHLSVSNHALGLWVNEGMGGLIRVRHDREGNVAEVHCKMSVGVSVMGVVLRVSVMQMEVVVAMGGKERKQGN